MEKTEIKQDLNNSHLPLVNKTSAPCESATGFSGSKIPKSEGIDFSFWLQTILTILVILGFAPILRSFLDLALSLTLAPE